MPKVNDYKMIWRFIMTEINNANVIPAYLTDINRIYRVNW